MNQFSLRVRIKSMSPPKKDTVDEQFKKKAVELLETHPDGLRYSDLREYLLLAGFVEGTIAAKVSKLDNTCPNYIWKPSKGLYQHVKYKQDDSLSVAPTQQTEIVNKIKEEDFYKPFADWLQNEIEDVTKAIPLGGNRFGEKWGTPDVIGKWQSNDWDIIKGITEIVSAEIKTDTNQLIIAFGQACAYKLFSHKVYLVVPEQSKLKELSKLDALCQIIGIGLVTFNVTSPDNPNFRILVRPIRHTPDLFYTNENMAIIKQELFS